MVILSHYPECDHPPPGLIPNIASNYRHLIKCSPISSKEAESAPVPRKRKRSHTSSCSDLKADEVGIQQCKGSWNGTDYLHALVRIQRKNAATSPCKGIDYTDACLMIQLALPCQHRTIGWECVALVLHALRSEHVGVYYKRVLLKWLVIHYQHIHIQYERQQRMDRLAHMYQALLLAVKQVSICADVCRLLCLLTRAEHVKPWRATQLQCMRESQEYKHAAYELGCLLAVYKSYHPGRISAPDTPTSLLPMYQQVFVATSPVPWLSHGPNFPAACSTSRECTRACDAQDDTGLSGGGVSVACCGTASGEAGVYTERNHDIQYDAGQSIKRTGDADTKGKHKVPLGGQYSSRVKKLTHNKQSNTSDRRKQRKRSRLSQEQQTPRDRDIAHGEGGSRGINGQSEDTLRRLSRRGRENNRSPSEHTLIGTHTDDSGKTRSPLVGGESASGTAFANRKPVSVHTGMNMRWSTVDFRRILSQRSADTTHHHNRSGSETISRTWWQVWRSEAQQVSFAFDYMLALFPEDTELLGNLSDVQRSIRSVVSELDASTTPTTTIVDRTRNHAMPKETHQARHTSETIHSGEASSHSQARSVSSPPAIKVESETSQKSEVPGSHSVNVSEVKNMAAWQLPCVRAFLIDCARAYRCVAVKCTDKANAQDTDYPISPDDENAYNPPGTHNLSHTTLISQPNSELGHGHPGFSAPVPVVRCVCGACEVRLDHPFTPEFFALLADYTPARMPPACATANTHTHIEARENTCDATPNVVHTKVPQLSGRAADYGLVSIVEMLQSWSDVLVCEAPQTLSERTSLRHLQHDLFDTGLALLTNAHKRVPIHNESPPNMHTDAPAQEEVQARGECKGSIGEKSTVDTPVSMAAIVHRLREATRLSQHSSAKDGAQPRPPANRANEVSWQEPDQPYDKAKVEETDNLVTSSPESSEDPNVVLLIRYLAHVLQTWTVNEDTQNVEYICYSYYRLHMAVLNMRSHDNWHDELHQRASTREITHHCKPPVYHTHLPFRAYMSAVSDSRQALALEHFVKVCLAIESDERFALAPYMEDVRAITRDRQFALGHSQELWNEYYLNQGYAHEVATLLIQRKPWRCLTPVVIEFRRKHPSPGDPSEYSNWLLSIGLPALSELSTSKETTSN